MIKLRLKVYCLHHVSFRQVSLLLLVACCHLIMFSRKSFSSQHFAGQNQVFTCWWRVPVKLYWTEWGGYRLCSLLKLPWLGGQPELLDILAQCQLAASKSQTRDFSQTILETRTTCKDKNKMDIYFFKFMKKATIDLRFYIWKIFIVLKR